MKLRSLIRWVLAGVVLLIVPVSGVFAHAELVRSDPAYGAVLPAPPPDVRLWFSEALDPAFSNARIVSASGATITTPQPSSRAPDDQHELVLPLNTLAAGTYTVIWQAVSAADGHKTVGTLVFTVAGAPSGAQAPGGTTAVSGATASAGVTAGPAVPAMAPGAMNEIERPTLPALVSRWLELAGALLLVGALVMGLGVLRPLAARDPDGIVSLVPVWRLALRAAIVLLGVGLAATLAVQAATVTGQGLGQVTRLPVLVPLLASRWGLLWAVRGWCVLLLVPLLLPSWWSLRAAPLYIALVIGVPLLLSFSLMSHADAMSNRLLTVGADWLHFATAAIWAGGLAVLLLLIRTTRSMDVPQRAPLTLQLVRGFSRLALGAVVVLVATGIFSATQMLDGLSELGTSDYGRVLLLKSGLAAVAFLLGGYHWLVAPGQIDAVPKRSSSTRRLLERLRGTVALESGGAALVIVAASALVQLPPPAHSHMQGMVMAPMATAWPTATAGPTLTPTAAATPTPAPFQSSIVTGGLTIKLMIDARTIGDRQFTVMVTDSGKAISPDLVRLQIKSVERDLGTTTVGMTPAGAGTFTAHSPALSLPGRWQVVVVVRRKGVEDVTAVFSVDVS